MPCLMIPFIKISVSTEIWMHFFALVLLDLSFIFLKSTPLDGVEEMGDVAM